ncbi:MAG: hypothetical protein JXR73_02650 [Candidatus Omnitrophica bacterium]|nr:hypothetical protein [Candidatus Omnitrophota bacterium]
MPEVEALETAEEDPRVQDVLSDFPEARLRPNYSEEHKLWIFEIHLGDWGEMGIAVVSPEQKKVIEFAFHPPDVDNDEKQEQAPLSLYRFFWNFRPRIEGPTLAWITFLIFVLFWGDFSKMISRRNLDILLLFSLCPFFNVIWLHPKTAYGGIFLITLVYFGYSVIQIWLPNKEHESNNIPSRRITWFVLALAMIFHIQKTYESGIDDSGVWSVIGAQYLQKSGQLPYGTEFGENCVYGPLMYALHIPANWIFPPNVEIDVMRRTVAMGEYPQFEMRGAQTIVLLFDFLTVFGMYQFGKRFVNPQTGRLLAIAYVLNPYILGMGGAFGLQQTSHMVGIPFVLYSLIFAGNPVIAGILLGLGCGLLYYPVFLFPLWMGWFVRTQSWKQTWKFSIMFACIGVVCLFMIIGMTNANCDLDHYSSLRAFFNDTIYQQQFSEGYGRSQFSFWGQYSNIAYWGKPLANCLYLVFCVSLVWMPYPRNRRALTALTASVLIGTQLVLSHGGGTYVGFYIAPFLLMLFCPKDSTEERHESS